MNFVLLNFYQCHPLYCRNILTNSNYSIRKRTLTPKKWNLRFISSSVATLYRNKNLLTTSLAFPTDYAATHCCRKFWDYSNEFSNSNCPLSAFFFPVPDTHPLKTLSNKRSCQESPSQHTLHPGKIMPGRQFQDCKPRVRSLWWRLETPSPSPN